LVATPRPVAVDQFGPTRERRLTAHPSRNATDGANDVDVCPVRAFASHDLAFDRDRSRHPRCAIAITIKPVATSANAPGSGTTLNTMLLN